MSRVLARPMFKKKAPKQSARGVGITSMLEDDVPGYAEGGEVDDRRERERVARELFEKNKDEMDGYQVFAQGERPQLFRQPATMPMAPQPTPQQMQAMQMQQMAAAQQAGMLPRFSEGGQVGSPPMQEEPSMWSRLYDRATLPFRERTGPIRDPNTGEPVQFYDPESMSDRIGYGIMDAATLLASRGKMNFPRPRPGGGGIEGPMTPSNKPGPWEVDRTGGPWSTPQPVPRRAPDVGPGEGGSVPQMPRSRSSVPEAGEVPRGPVREPGGETRLPPGFGNRVGSAVSNAEEVDIEEPDYTDEGSPAGDYGGEGGGIMGGRTKGKAAPKPKDDSEDEGDDSEKKPTSRSASSDLTSIKAERAAKQDALRRENIWLAMMQAGLAIAGGKSSNAVTNIGQGGQAGLGAFITLEQQRRRDEDAAMRRDIAERELQLQQRRLTMQEPYYAALTSAAAAKPGIAEQQRMMRVALAQQNAAKEASRLWETHVKNNMELQTMAPALKEVQRRLFIKQETDKLLPGELLRLQPGVGMAAAPASSADTSSED